MIKKYNKHTPPNALGYYQKRAGLTNEELASKVGVSTGHLVKLKNGTKRLNTDHLSAFAEALDCEQGQILEADPEGKSEENQSIVRDSYKKEARRVVNLMTVQTPFEHDIDF
jgi:DNA-binding Xre family transcriptional regulator